MHTPTTRPRSRGIVKSTALTAAEINQSSIAGFRITPNEARAMLDILTKHDGSTLTPERGHHGRAVVSRMFDKLRFNLREMTEQEVIS